MSARPRLLDLFCGAGGAAMGYHRAGFDVVGVDNRPQPRYPFEFHEGDAMAWPLDGFDAIHASPPCQDHMRSPMPTQKHHDTGWMLPQIRDKLTAAAIPWVIENVPGAPMRVDYRLCGCLFGLEVRRERWFETSWQGFDLRAPCVHIGPAIDPMMGNKSAWARAHGRPPLRAEIRQAMGVEWMRSGRPGNRGYEEARQAIPPAYTEYIGGQLLTELENRPRTADAALASRSAVTPGKPRSATW